MAIPADQVATLRAYLAGDRERYQRLRESMDREAARKTYLALLEAACFKAIDRRFAGKRIKSGDVIEFVGDVRARSAAASELLDPRAGERLIRAVLGDGDIDDFDDKTRFDTELTLLTALIADEQLDEAGLDAFLESARKIADRWTS